jgi:competence ComEA-like helix-hairpin-helix protein
MFFTGLVYLVFAANAQTLPPGQGQKIVQQKCGGCHAMKVVTSKRASRQQWASLVDQMVTRGADIPEDDIETVIDYLFKNFGPAPGSGGAAKSTDQTGPVNVNSATAPELSAALGLSTEESTSIVSYRKQNGNFKEWRDLTKVPGIDAKKIEVHKDRIVF